MEEEKNPVLDEINKEIEETKRKTAGDEFEIEIAEEQPEEKIEAKKEEEKPKEKISDEDLSKRVQARINKITQQRRDAELETKRAQEETAQLKARLERLEKGSETQAQNEFQNKYELTKKALVKAVEEGDTEAQVNFQEQLADMRAAMRVAEMQKQMQQTQAVSPTVGRAQQTVTNPAPEKAMAWWQKNNWFNSQGYERETAAARAIDVQLDLEGYDKNSDEYYNLLNNRLRNMFPELISESEVVESKPRAKSRQPVSPTAGGSTYKGNRVRMTQDQLRMARELGINDEASLKKYASEIQKSQRS
jgi:hypothetical protein